MNILGYISDVSGNTTSPFDPSHFESDETGKQDQAPLESPATEPIRESLQPAPPRKSKSYLVKCKEPQELPLRSQGMDFWAPLHQTVQQSFISELEALGEPLLPEDDSARLIDNPGTKIRHMEAVIRALRADNHALRNEKISIIAEYERVIKKLLAIKLGSPSPSVQQLERPSPTEGEKIKRMGSLESLTLAEAGRVAPEATPGCSGNCELHCKFTDKHQQVSLVAQKSEITDTLFNPFVKAHVEFVSSQSFLVDKEELPSTPTTTASLPPMQQIRSARHTFQPLYQDSQKLQQLFPIEIDNTKTVVSTTVKRIKVDGLVVYEKPQARTSAINY